MTDLDAFMTCSFAPLQYFIHFPDRELWLYCRDRHGRGTCVTASSPGAAVLPYLDDNVHDILLVSEFPTNERYDTQAREEAELIIKKHIAIIKPDMSLAEVVW